MPMMKIYKICCALVGVIGLIGLANSILGFSTFHDVSAIFGSVPVHWMLVLEFATSFFSLATIGVIAWRMKTRKSPEFFLCGHLCLLCLLLSVMTVELSLATLIEVKIGTLYSDMNRTISTSYGQPFYASETEAIDQMHRKWSCCSMGGKQPQELWRSSRWLLDQSEYPLQRVPRSCCVYSDDSVQHCKTANTTFCSWIRSAAEADLCSGNTVLPPGIQWEDLFFHEDCYTIMEEYVLAYCSRSLGLVIGNMCLLLFMLVVDIHRYHLSLSRFAEHRFALFLPQNDLIDF